MSHLIVDIKHSLLDLLIDLLRCVDESLSTAGSKTERRDLILICMKWTSSTPTISIPSLEINKKNKQVQISVKQIGLGSQPPFFPFSHHASLKPPIKISVKTENRLRQMLKVAITVNYHVWFVFAVTIQTESVNCLVEYSTLGVPTATTKHRHESWLLNSETFTSYVSRKEEKK